MISLSFFEVHLKKLIFTNIILFAVSIYFFLSKNKNKSTEIHQVFSISKISQSKKLIDQVKDSPGLAQANLSSEEMNGPCKESLSAIETMPLNTLVYDLGHGSLKLDTNCLFKSKNDIKALKGFPEVCAKIENSQPSQQCIEKMFMYKALRIHHATINDSIENMATDVLIHKFIGILAEDGFNSPVGLRQLKEAGAILQQRLPESESAAKAALVGYMASTENMIPEDQKKFEDMLSESRKKFPENWEIYEMTLAQKKSKGEEDFKNEVLNNYKSRPDSAVSLYFMGCLKWSENQVAEAQNFFKQALQKAPQQSRFQYTLDLSQKAQPPEKICVLQMNFDPDKF